MSDSQPRGASAPRVVVLLDPDDDAAVTGALLDAHDPAAGHIVVHPTPGSSGLRALAHDLLAALGRPVTRLAAEQISGALPAWKAAIAWITADRIGLVVVLRAHLLSAAGWEQLVELQRCTGVRLVLTCHTARLDGDTAAALDGVDHHVTADLADALPPPAEVDPDGADIAAAADSPDEPGLPVLPDSDWPHFRADARRRLSDVDFARIDAAYGHGLDAACAWLAEHPEPRQHQLTGPEDYLRPVFPRHLRTDEIAAGVALLQAGHSDRALRELARGLLCIGRDHRQQPIPWADTDGLQLFLSSLAADSPGRRHTVARLRGAQAGFTLHGLHLTLPADLRRAGGPGITTGTITAAAAERIRADLANPVRAAALAAAVFTGLAPRPLASARISGLSDDATALGIPTSDVQGRPPGEPLWFSVPTAARPLLTAARTYLQLRGADPAKRLLSSGIGTDAATLTDSADTCAVALPDPVEHPAGTWHAQARCWRIGQPLHGARTPP